MKTFFLIVLFFSVLTIQAQEKAEYCILRVTYSVKPNNLDARLSIDIGTDVNHSTLKGIFQNNKGDSINVNNPDGSVTVIKNEVDFFSVINKYGFNLINTYTVTLLEKSYTNFVFEKKKGN